MSEEDVVVGTSEDDTNPAVEKAVADGWRPQEEWEGDPKQWVDYGEFNYRGELMGRISEQSSIIHSQNSQLKEFKLALEDMKDMTSKIADAEYTKIMNQLKAQKVEAISEGDGETVADVDEQIDQLKQARADMQADKSAKADDSDADNDGDDTLHPEVQSWLVDPQNQWYNTDALMRGAANELATTIQKANPSFGPAQVLKEVNKQIRKEMPHKFPRNNVGSGDSGGRSNSSTRRSVNSLSDAEREAGKRFVKLKVFKTMDEYIEQLDAIGER